MTFFTYPTFWEHSGVTLDPFCEVTLDRNVLCWMAPTTNSFQLFVRFKLFCSSFTRPERTRSCAQECPPKKCKSKSLRDPSQALEKEDWAKFGEGGWCISGRFMRKGIPKIDFASRFPPRRLEATKKMKKKNLKKDVSNFGPGGPQNGSRVTPKCSQRHPRSDPKMTPKSPQSDFRVTPKVTPK